MPENAAKQAQKAAFDKAAAELEKMLASMTDVVHTRSEILNLYVQRDTYLSLLVDVLRGLNVNVELVHTMGGYRQIMRYVFGQGAEPTMPALKLGAAQAIVNVNNMTRRLMALEEELRQLRGEQAAPAPQALPSPPDILADVPADEPGAVATVTKPAIVLVNARAAGFYMASTALASYAGGKVKDIVPTLVRTKDPAMALRFERPELAEEFLARVAKLAGLLNADGGITAARLKNYEPGSLV